MWGSQGSFKDCRVTDDDETSTAFTSDTGKAREYPQLVFEMGTLEYNHLRHGGAEVITTRVILSRRHVNWRGHQDQSEWRSEWLL
jgi:hypothetical protein